MRRVRWLVVSLVVLLAASTMAAVAQDTSNLSEVKQRIQRIGNDISEAERAAGAARSQLADADARLAEVEAIVNQIAREVDLQEERVAQAEADLEALRAHAAEVQAAFDARAVHMYKYSFGSDLDMVLAAADIQEAMDRQTLLERVNRSDRATLEQVRAAQGAVLTQQEVLDRELEQLEDQRAEQEEVLEQVRVIRASAVVADADARARVSELSQQHATLQKEQKAIERLIAERARAAQTIAPTAASRGGYVWPSCGQVTSEFGRRWGRLHAGIDIVDNQTRAIHASRAGRVAFTGWQGGYGNLTLVDHGDGVVTAYAHQSQFQVSEGQQVSRGQRIGTIGNTGNSTGPHLHFEIRVGGTAHNPRNFLPRGC